MKKTRAAVSGPPPKPSRPHMTTKALPPAPKVISALILLNTKVSKFCLNFLTDYELCKFFSHSQ